jgi:hypothetical protein
LSGREVRLYAGSRLLGHDGETERWGDKETRRQGDKETRDQRYEASHQSYQPYKSHLRE